MNRVGIDETVKKLKETLSAQGDILLVFLFGSFVSGDMTSLSDLDVAIYFNDAVDFYRINTLREDISEMLGIETDIVVLNTASPVIKMQVLKKGGLLINKDQRAYNDFFVNTVKEYDDLKRTRKEIEEKILRGRIYA
ncbi:MAG: nucleotidyltransferase domain-containing protein [Nitrospirota bacterium]